MDTVSFHQEEGVGWLRLCRPSRRNAVSVPMLEELLSLIPKLHATEGLLAMVVTGEGDAFCSGLDTAESAAMFGWLAAAGVGTDDPVAAGVRRAQEVVKGIAGLPFPTIAAVRGPAIGGGFELALACDFVIAAEDAVFGLPEVQLGMVPDWGGTQRLPRLIGLSRAKAMVLLGERMSARQALEWGVTIVTTPVDELESTAGHMATRLAGTSADALQAAKRLLDTAMDDGIDAGLTRESIAQSGCVRMATTRRRNMDLHE